MKYATNHLKDENCVLAILLKDDPKNKSQIVVDLMDFLIGASDTTPATLSQALLWLKWHPEKTWVLEQEINKIFPEGFDLSKITADKVEEIDYLMYYLKELLWIDCPVALTFY